MMYDPIFTVHTTRTSVTMFGKEFHLIFTSELTFSRILRIHTQYLRYTPHTWTSITIIIYIYELLVRGWRDVLSISFGRRK